MKPIPVLLTAAQPCGYLAGNLSRSLFIDPATPMTLDLYGSLLAQGFRRSGNEVYRPFCQTCSACVPTRLAVAAFKPNRYQRRCWKKNAATCTVIKPALFESVHYDLYLRYQLARHADGDMAYATAESYFGFLASSWCTTYFVEFWIDHRLAAVTVVDRVENAVSAVYTFYEPDFAHYSLGTFAILWQIRQALSWQCEYLYLGFWIKECQKMAYKNQFQPLQKLLGEHWTAASEA